MDDTQEFLVGFGDRVRQLRKAKGLSQEELAFRSDLDRTYISGIECGRRNVSIINLCGLAGALELHVAEMLRDLPSSAGCSEHSPLGSYVIREGFEIQCGLAITSEDIAAACEATGRQLEALPFSLFQCLDLKAVSGMVGALFASNLAPTVSGIVNPIEKGHPDVIPQSGLSATEEELRNYPEGLEIKCTVGNVAKGSNLETGQRRLGCLTGITWQAHHREVGSLLGLVIDFAGRESQGRRYPLVAAAFYADGLIADDWGKISGVTGRNTKVTGMRSSGKRKMGRGWVLQLRDGEYRERYEAILHAESA